MEDFIVALVAFIAVLVPLMAFIGIASGAAAADHDDAPR
jgi:hypothetical protein